MTATPPELLDWLTRGPRIEVDALVPLGGDASVRRYFRVSSGSNSYVVMLAPRDMPGLDAYRAIGERLIRIGLQAPRVLDLDPAAGFYLVTDLGDTHYLEQLDPGNADRLYTEAMDALLTMQAELGDLELAPYDYPMLMREMDIFREWYIERHLGLQFDKAQGALWQAAREQLAQHALAQPVTFVHRDYHSRNLLVTGKGTPGILDFQDAVRGPITYDLVSLLRDCYIAWPADRVHGWLTDFHRRLRARSMLPSDVDLDTFGRWFDAMGAQRHLKAVGIFARLHHRDGKPGYLGDIPRTMAYIRSVARRDPTLRMLDALLRQLPVEAPAA